MSRGESPALKGRANTPKPFQGWAGWGIFPIDPRICVWRVLCPPGFPRTTMALSPREGTRPSSTMRWEFNPERVDTQYYRMSLRTYCLVPSGYGFSGRFSINTEVRGQEGLLNYGCEVNGDLAQGKPQEDVQSMAMATVGGISSTKRFRPPTRRFNDDALRNDAKGAPR